MLPAVVLTAAAVIVLLGAEARGVAGVRAAAKLLASTGFVAAAVAAGATATAYGQGVLVALVLSWLGDALLIARGARGLFAVGLASFLGAHLVYATSFASLGLARLGVGAAAIVAAGALAATLRWLRPHLPPKLRRPVQAYMGVISLMWVCAAGASAATGHATLFAGASLFYVSDLAVARQRFVAPSFWNRAWGLPAYYAGQLLLASTVRL